LRKAQIIRHSYQTSLRWTGNRGTGTSDYRAYGRDHELAVTAKSVTIPGSSDPHFRGDAARYNPEELLVASVSACHMLSYLHVCAVNGVVVTSYEDEAMGTMVETPDGGGSITAVTLKPRVTISASSDPAKARALHHDAHQLCFIANSVRFPIDCEPTIATQGESQAWIAPA
jgi:organic hydroperoxide reductase OsmC/OhrA